MNAAAGLAVIGLLTAAAPPPGASGCSGCHGDTAPIAGRDAKDLTARLLAFRSGEVPSTVMRRIAKGFTPTELAAIAGWWAGRK